MDLGSDDAKVHSKLLLFKENRHQHPKSVSIL